MCEYSIDLRGDMSISENKLNFWPTCSYGKIPNNISYAKEKGKTLFIVDNLSAEDVYRNGIGVGVNFTTTYNELEYKNHVCNNKV